MYDIKIALAYGFTVRVRVSVCHRRLHLHSVLYCLQLSMYRPDLL